nr:tetratricopeptide repeat protein [Deltaproteobacteria bacterium]
LHTLRASKTEGSPPWPATAPAVPRHVVEVLVRGLSPRVEDRWPSMEPLLETLARPLTGRPSRWWIGMMGLGVVPLVGVGLYAGNQAQQGVQPCTDAPARLAEVWSPPRREQVRAAILGVQRPYSAAAWEYVREALDGYAAAWTSMHTEACEATAIHGVQSQHVLDLRMRCLERGAVELGAAAETLAGADEALVLEAPAVVGHLPPLSRCADTDALDAEVEPPLPAEAEAVEQARLALARARSRNRADRLDEASALLREAEAAVDGVEYGPVRTEIARLSGDIAVGQGQYDDASDFMREAVTLALRWEQRDELFEASMELMRLTAVNRGQPREGLLYWPFVAGQFRGDSFREARARSFHAGVLGAGGRLADAEREHRAALVAFEHSGSTDALRLSRMRSELGATLLDQGRNAEAESEYRVALEELEHSVGLDHPRATTARQGLAAALRGQGKTAEAAIEDREAYRMLLAALGPEHPRVAKALTGVAISLSIEGKLEESEAAFRKAALIRENALGPKHPRVASAWSNVGTVMLEQGKVEEAVPVLRRTVPVLEEALGPEHPKTLATRMSLATALQRLRHPETEAELREILGLQLESSGPDHPHTAIIRRVLAKELLLTDRAAEALVFAEQAWKVHDQENANPTTRARSAFVLAQVLWVVSHPARDRQRAVQLAEDARRVLAAAEQKSDSVDEVEQWQRDHRVPRAGRDPDGPR